MAEEVISFADMSDGAVTLSKEVSLLLNHFVPLQLLMDSKCVFDIIFEGSRTSERRLMLGLGAAREHFCKSNVSEICLVRSTDYLADGLTKWM